MKTTCCMARTFALALLYVLLFTACDSGGGGSNPPAQQTPPPPSTPALPTVTIAAPTGSVNRIVALSASVSAPSDVTITSVEFMVDGTVIGTTDTDPYTVEWDTSTVSDGDYVVIARATDSSGRTTTSSPVTFTVLNHPVIRVELSAAEVLPAIESSATGAGELAFDLLTGAVTGGVTIEGLAATLAHIHRGFAGANGPVVVDFVQDPTDPTRWNAVEGAMLSAEDIDNLLAGALYVNVHSAAHPTGEIRGQIKPENISVVFSPMSNEQVVSAAPDAASGTIATTIDANASAVTIHAITSALVEPMEAHVHRAAAGENAPDVVLALTQAQDEPTHWLIERQTVTAEQLADLTANLWYVDVHTTGLPAGAVRGQIIVSASPPPPPPPAAPTLAELQSTIFGPVCSGCHNGLGDVLPGAMNLSSTDETFAALVNVPSAQQPGRIRVIPNDSANSYLIHKLEGAPGITGSRMPLGGPFLDQATIDGVKAWIDAGAQN